MIATRFEDEHVVRTARSRPGSQRYTAVCRCGWSGEPRGLPLVAARALGRAHLRAVAGVGEVVCSKEARALRAAATAYARCRIDPRDDADRAGVRAWRRLARAAAAYAYAAERWP